MRWLITIIMFLAFAQSAQAVEYKVQRGDTMSQLSVRHTTTVKSLDSANPQIATRNAKYTGEKRYWLWEGQIIDVPSTKSTKQAAVAKPVEKIKRNSQGVGQWKVVNGNPFGLHRNPATALLRLPDSTMTVDDKEALAVSIQQSSEPYQVKSGELFDWVLFGNYYWQSKVAWVGKEPLEAEIWPEVSISSARICRVTRTKGCKNLEVNCEDAPLAIEPALPVAALPPPIIEPLPAVVPPVEPPVIILPHVQPPVAVPLVVLPPVKKYSHEEYLFSGTGSNPLEHYVFYGVDGTFYFKEYGTGKRKFRTGVSAQLVGWKGETNGVSFKGNKQLIGLAHEIKKGEDSLTFKLRLGKKFSDITSEEGKYRDKEAFTLLNMEVVNVFEVQKGKILQLSQIGTVVDIDLGGEKNSTFNGSKIDPAKDPRLSGNEYKIFVELDNTKFKKVTPYLSTQYEYREGDENNALDLKLGAKFLKDNKLDISAGHRTSSKYPEEVIGQVSYKISFD